jgi:hypothetical protein
MRRQFSGSEILSPVRSLRKTGKLILRIVCCTHFSLAVIVAKQLQELPYEKRQGSSVARAWINKLTFDLEKSTSEACSLLSLLEFVPKTAKALEEEPNVVVQRLEEVRKYRELILTPG